MATDSEALAVAIQHHQEGRLQAAEPIYRQILAVEPNHADAIHLLGLIAHQMGRHETAIEYIGRAIRWKGDAAAFHNHLGQAHCALRRMPEAVACFRRALELKPEYAEAHNNLGAALNNQGQRDAAVACYRRALELKPDYAAAHYNLGIACKDQGQLDEAIICYRRALELKPDYAEAHNNLGAACYNQGQLDEAVACYRRALELKPDYTEVHNNLGAAFNDQKNLDDAVVCYRRALDLKPDYAEACNNLGVAFNEQGKWDEAVSCYRRALELKPDYAEAHNNLGRVFKEQGRLDDAVDNCRRALELKPDYAEAHNNLGAACHNQGRLDEAAACYRRALELKPDFAEAHSNLLCTLQYGTGVTPGLLADAHAEFDRRHAAPLCGAGKQMKTVRDHRGRLRLGFVSPDLGRHPVGYFLVRVLELLVQESLETICYSDRIFKDSMTQRLQVAATHWRNVRGLDDERLAEQIRSDRVDILFDLTGHTAHNRLLAFARKSAPIQITWIGYEGTTGLSAMDYLLADRHVVPEGSQPYYREQILRMPDGYLCYDPPGTAPPVSSLPALTNGYPTFGSFNNLAKFTPQVVAVWSAILRRVPAAQLVLKYRGLGEPTVKRRYLDLFASHGVEPHRLQLLPPSSYAEYLATYQQVDLALDPFPFSGSTTTCEALWMGVPVVTCPFETFASRHSLSHLSNVGLKETIARDLDEYVELAVSLAGDLPRLASLRAGLRDRMAASPLCDGKRFAANLASQLRELPHQPHFT